MQNNTENVLIDAELVKQMGNQAEHAVTHDSEPQLKLDTEEVGVVAPLELAKPNVTTVQTSLNEDKIDVAANVAKEFIQTVADSGKRTVDAVDEFASKTSLATRNAALAVKETSVETAQFVQLKAADIRRFALLAIEWIEARGRMAKNSLVSNAKLVTEALILNSKLAGKNIASKGQFLAITATKAADSLSEGAFEKKESAKRTVRSWSEKVNHEIEAITEPSTPMPLSRFDLSLPSSLLYTEEEKRILQTEEEREPSLITNELIQNIREQSQHAMTHEAEPEVEVEETGKVSHLVVETTESTDLRSSLQASILMAKKELKTSNKALPVSSEPQSIRSN